MILKVALFCQRKSKKKFWLGLKFPKVSGEFEKTLRWIARNRLKVSENEEKVVIQSREY